MIYKVTLHPGKREDYVKEFGRIKNEVCSQKGCIEYDIYLDSVDPRFNNPKREDLAVILEKWDTLESLQEHSRSEVMADFRRRVKNLKCASNFELLTIHKIAISQ